MARPRQFDDQEVRQSALQAFLRDGYGETSLNALEMATGLGRRSLYNSFGDKHTLFLQVLQEFRALAAQRHLAPLEVPGAGLDAIAAVLGSLVEAANTEVGRWGCLICNTAREPIARDPAVAQQIQLYFSRIERGFARVLTTAQSQGELPAEANVSSLAHFYLGILVTLCVLARAGTPIDTLQDIAGESLRKIR